MRLVIQRVKWAAVQCSDLQMAEIGQGLLILAGFGGQDDQDLPDSAAWNKIVLKIPDLRIFPDNQGRSNLSLHDIQGQILLVSQFTLFADCRKGRRPSFTRAADPEVAHSLYDRLYAQLQQLVPHRVQQGIFGADMDLTFCNWGPVTIILDSADFQQT